MSVTTLYGLAVLIWGTTWFAIKLQLGAVAPEASIAYRFLLAAMILVGINFWRKRNLRFPIQDHAWFIAQGVVLFSINYILHYYACAHLTSGVVAVVSSTMVAMNILNSIWFFKKPMEGRVIAGAAMGIGGLGLIFRHELAAAGRHEAIIGVALTLAGSYLASLGNMVSVRNHKRGIGVMEANTFSMGYGAICTVLVTFLRGIPFTVEWNARYIGSLAYLAIFGSVIAFACYLTVIGRIGAARAGYVTVLYPVVALLLSTLFEHYEWTGLAALGVVFTLAGNALILLKMPGK